jgi:hypothetical protein
MNKQKKSKLALKTDTVRRLGDQDLTNAGGAGVTQTICPTVMQTHCFSCIYRNTCLCY